MNMLSEYQHPIVRDLAWALSSPPLMQYPNDDRWVDGDWCKLILSDYQPHLFRLDKDPDALITAVSAQKDKRLGNYFETLWAYWLQTNPRYQLVARNLPIRDGKTTIGELDFIVYDKATDRHYHWEVAVKFYLGVSDTSMANHWYGPGLKDRLDIKLRRLIDHQIRLTSHPSAVKTLDDLGITIDGHAIILKGRLFYPDTDASPPHGTSKSHLRGWWQTSTDFISTHEAGSSNWLVLGKMNWLAPINHINSTQAQSTAQLCKHLVGTPLCHPMCIINCEDELEITRGFIVPNDWKAAEQSI